MKEKDLGLPVTYTVAVHFFCSFFWYRHVFCLFVCSSYKFVFVFHRIQRSYKDVHSGPRACITASSQSAKTKRLRAGSSFVQSTVEEDSPSR